MRERRLPTVGPPRGDYGLADVRGQQGGERDGTRKVEEPEPRVIRRKAEIGSVASTGWPYCWAVSLRPPEGISKSVMTTRCVGAREAFS
jgi:hypothetical protein